MSTRYATTQHNRLERVKSAIGDVYSRVECYRLTSNAMIELLQEVWQSSDYRKLPAYDRGYLHGISDTKRNAIWHSMVEWRLGPATGPIRTAGGAWTDEMSELARTPGMLYGGHYWKGTDKPFTEYRPTN